MVCTNEGTPIIIQYGYVCGVSKSTMSIFFNNDGDWKENKYCEYSCHENGNGYVGSFCCEESEYPSAKPSDIPSSHI